jgi:hypothetical protein
MFSFFKKLLQENLKAYVYFNIAFYSLMIIFMIYTLFNPELQLSIREQVESAIAQSSLFGEYFAKTRSGNFTFHDSLFFTPLIWMKNIYSAFLSIYLPSLIIPFSGVLLGFFQTFAFGVGFSPIDGLSFVFLQKLLLITLEGQAAILAITSSFIMSKYYVKGLKQKNLRFMYYKEGVIKSSQFFTLSIAMLLIAAIYEGLILISW